VAWRSKGGDILNADLVRLEREQLEQLADLVAERLAGAGRVLASRLVDAKEVARWLNVEPDFVYANAVALGARRLGDGPKARLRFDLREVDERARRLAATCSTGRESAERVSPAQAPIRRRRSRRSLGTGVHLLPIRDPIDARDEPAKPARAAA